MIGSDLGTMISLVKVNDILNETKQMIFEEANSVQPVYTVCAIQNKILGVSYKERRGIT